MHWLMSQLIPMVLDDEVTQKFQVFSHSEIPGGQCVQLFHVCKLLAMPWAGAHNARLRFQAHEDCQEFLQHSRHVDMRMQVMLKQPYLIVASPYR